jgi:hypothetical protein
MLKIVSSRHNSNSFSEKKKKKILNNCKVLSQVLLCVVTNVVSGITVSTTTVHIFGEAGNVGVSVSFGTE